MRVHALRRHVLSLLSVSTVILTSCITASSPAVTVKLQTSWKSPQLPLEILETAAVEDPEIFWPLLDSLTQPELGIYETEKEYYEKVLELLGDGFLSDPVTLGSFELGLSLHTAAPKIEAYYQFYNTSVVPSLEGNYYPSCETWVYWRGQQICSPDGLDNVLREPGTNLRKVKELPFDHVCNPTSEAETVILYADIQNEIFKDFHSVLQKAAEDGAVRYILRYRPVTGYSLTRPLKNKPLFVAGYGVELMLKKTDYIVIDDREVETDHPERPQKPILEPISSEEIPVITPLHTSELGILGYQAVQLISSSSSPLETLQRLSQDFPSQSSKIAAVKVDDEFVALLRENNRIIPGGENLFWMNGMMIPRDKVEAFNLLSVMRRERTLINSLRQLDLSSDQAVKLLSHEKIAEKIEMGGTNRFDIRDDIEGGKVIVWMNDLEKDSRYKQWPVGIRNMLRPLYPGQLHSLRKNVHHAVFVLDLQRKEDLSRLVEEVANLVKRQVPIRFGIVALPVDGDVDGERMARIFYHLIESYGRAVAMKFAEDLLEGYDKANLMKKVKSLYTEIYQKSTILSGHEKIAYDDLMASASTDDIARTRSWATRLGINPKEGAIFGNGQVFLKDDNWINKIGSGLSEDVQILQKAIYAADISDEDDILEFLFQDAPKRRNQYIFPTESGGIKYVNLVNGLSEKGIIYVPGEKTIDETDKSTESSTVIWVVDDFDSHTGLELIKEAAAFQSKHPHVTIGLVHNPGSTTGPPNLSLMLYYLATNGLLDDSAGIHKFRQLVQEVDLASHDKGDEMEKILGVKAASWRTIDTERARQFWESSRSFIHAAGFKAGERGIVINGRVIGPIRGDDIFGVMDFEALQSYESKERIRPAVEAALEMVVDGSDAALFAAQLTSIVSVSSKSDVPPGIFDTPTYSRRRSYDLLNPKVGVLEFGSPDNAIFQFAITLDPLSEQAQKWSSIIKVLSGMKGVYIRVFLNPKTTTTELPIARFYRYVLSKSIEFDDKGSVKDPAAVFLNIPEDPLLTMGLEVPPAWVVVSKESIHDLDNIVLSKLSSTSRETGLAATYELKNILIDGHARDVTLGNSPSGMQIVLGTGQNPHVVDTIVMANLGYLQLKANPGVWTLDLKDGRSKDIFALQSVGSEGWSSRDVETIGADIVLTSFEGITIYPRVVRREGKELANVLEAEEPTGFVNQAEKFVGKWKNKFMGGTKEVVKGGSSQAEINIFSVASGHLYERFIYIMIQSVLNHTNSTVKFWFIENFLSPSFKTFIPLLAEELGFDYELVTYKWPYWLRGQREKQREIWGYKILFLDVLFPLDLDKVIFVDADQIVRTDLKQLVDLDLQGAPYGYTPMCDSRAELEGFRFWKTGFWKDWLKGLPYHISALYVVDLKRFRQIAAGDRLRGTYQALSSDKNSLANLDQDLPNYAQHHIPIFSLPQEWLWCETWCSMDTLSTAKTIDLCNDPLTKTPKLTRAKRIPEWTTYDKQVAEMAQRLLKKAASQKNGSDGTAVDESMFVQIDSPSQKDPQKVEVEDKEDEARVKDEL